MKLFNRTNLYSINNDDKIFKILNGWFDIMKDHKRILYNQKEFDMDYFIETLDKILSIDHFMVMYKVLEMIYNSSVCFIGEFRRKLFVEFLVKKWFKKLFGHWNYCVRNAYQHLILYRGVLLRRSHLNWAKYDKIENDLF